MASKFDHEFENDGVRYMLRDGTRVMVRGNSIRKATVTLSKNGLIVAPETGNLGGSAFRTRLVEAARERFGEVNGLADDLGAIADAFDGHLRERQEGAAGHGRLTHPPELAAKPYRISENGGFVRMKPTQGGEVPVELTNFLARVEEEVVVDDGAEQGRIYKISGRIGDRRLPTVDVEVSRFVGMNWVSELWGLEAHIMAGQNSYAREAIELYSRTKKRFRYAHTGWRVLEDGRRAFLHSGGAIA